MCAAQHNRNVLDGVGWVVAAEPSPASILPVGASREQLELLLVLTLGLTRQLLDAVERDLLGGDKRTLRAHRAHQAFLHQVELAYGLPRQHGRRVETGLALERGAQLPQRGVLAHAADEP